MKNKKLKISDVFCKKTQNKSSIILGFDPILDQIPNFINKDNDISTILVDFFSFMIETLHDKVAAIKFQSADFEYFGLEGYKALALCLKKSKQAQLLNILDVKRGDIGRSSQAYANAYLNPLRQNVNHIEVNDFEADAITISPYMGTDSIESFIDVANTHNKMLFILLRTSNPGASFVQNHKDHELFLYEKLANWIQEKNHASLGEYGFGSLGVVVGATQEVAIDIRKRLSNSLFLMPGLGAQGGSGTWVKACMNKHQDGVIAPVSRALLYPANKESNRKEYQQKILDTLKQLQASLT